MTKPETIFGHPLGTSICVIGRRLSWFFKLAVALFFTGIASGLRAEERLFTDTDDRTVKASVVRVDDENATLRVGTKNHEWPLEKLSAADRAFLGTWKSRYEASRAESGCCYGNGERDRLPSARFPSSRAGGRFLHTMPPDPVIQRPVCAA